MTLFDSSLITTPLLSEGGNLFWLGLIIGLIIWKYTQDIMKTIVITAMLFSLFIPFIFITAINPKIITIGVLLFLIYIIERYLVK